MQQMPCLVAVRVPDRIEESALQAANRQPTNKQMNTSRDKPMASATVEEQMMHDSGRVDHVQ